MTYDRQAAPIRATLHNTFVEDAANGHCSNAVAAVQRLITASGPVSLP